MGIGGIMNFRQSYINWFVGSFFWKIIKKLVPFKIINSLRYKMLSFSTKVYSQEGEELILDRLFEDINNGFYVDVGANHPRLCSNTHNFYKKGWRGINIEPIPENIDLFKKYRKDDVNIEVAIDEKEGKIPLYVFKNTLLSSCSKEFAENVDRNALNEGDKIKSIIEVNSMRLDSVFDRFLPKDKKIDFLDIDAEGYDMNVLKSNNWNKYRPKVILVEDHFSTFIDDIFKSDIYSYLVSKGYKFFSRLYFTQIFLEDSFKPKWF